MRAAREQIIITIKFDKDLFKSVFCLVCLKKHQKRQNSK